MINYVNYRHCYDVNEGQMSEKFAADYAALRPKNGGSSAEQMAWLQKLAERVEFLVLKIEHKYPELLKLRDDYPDDKYASPASCACELVYIYSNAKKLNLNVFTTDPLKNGRYLVSPQQIARVVQNLDRVADPEDGTPLAHCMLILDLAVKTSQDRSFLSMFASRLPLLTEAMGTALSTRTPNVKAAEHVLALLEIPELQGAVTIGVRNATQYTYTRKATAENFAHPGMCG